MQEAAADLQRTSPMAQDELRHLQLRSDTRGLLRLGGHLAAIVASAWLDWFLLTHSTSIVFHAVGAVVLGFTLVTMFAAMHESVHRTAFKTRRLNDGVAWFAGLLSFYNSTFYRPYHGWHHRFTQIPGKDPELDEKKPVDLASYLYAMSGVPWWLGKLHTHFRLALGETGAYPFLNGEVAAEVVRSVRLQLLVYVAAIALSAGLGYPYFVVYWLVPVAVGQPMLRVILLAEHTGCTENDDALTNTRTTYTVLPVRFLMWEMPYHAEHHRFPALPFFSLARTHSRLGPQLLFVARRGYLGLHAEFIKSLRRST
jgi:fatty acid desaturase